MRAPLACAERPARASATQLGKKLDVVIAFLADLSSQLEAVSGKLDELQASTAAIRQEVRRLTGKPVLEVLDSISEDEAARASELRDSVYIELQLVGRGNDPTRPFEPDKKENPAEPFERTLHDFLSGNQQVLLLSGGARLDPNPVARSHTR